jgi:hypothetical protein
MTITNSSESKINWNHNLATNPNAKIIKSLGNMVFLRGDKIYDEGTTFEADYFGLDALYSNKLSMGLHSFRDSHRLFGHEKSIGVFSNNASHIPILEKTLRRATMMLHEKAYVHHYEKFGVDKDKFDEAFLTCEATLAEYKNL